MKRSDLVHPWPLLAVLLLVVNDHLLKGSGWLPGWATGKLSDFAGLFFFPILLTLSVERWLENREGARSVVASWAAAITGVVFTVLKTVPGAAALLSRVMLVPSYLYLVRHLRRPTAPLWAQRLAILVAATASMATSAPRYRHGYALWEASSQASWPVGCATATVWVSKSGKTGLGVTLRLEGDRVPCKVRVVAATLNVADAPPVTADVIVPMRSSDDVGHPDPQGLVYLGFAFDNEKAWNAGVVTATLHLTLAAEGAAPVSRDVALVQRYEGYDVLTEYPGSRPPAAVVTKPVVPVYRAASPDAGDLVDPSAHP